jgi:hypothetical protein
MALMTLTDSYQPTRAVLHTVAVHIVARARLAATGRFGLRVTPGGFGTPEFGDGPQRVRVSGALLIVESGAASAASSRAIPIDNAAFRELADFAGVDLETTINVGQDTPPRPDPQAILHVDGSAADTVGQWFDVTNRALDRVGEVVGPTGLASLVQLWPEHFDCAFDIAYDDADPKSHRVNLGGSPGDGFEPMPYVYVGPWNSDRPGDREFWNAPFGAVLRHHDVADSSDPVGEVSDFFLQGLRYLRG